ncbi:uncharacterized protein TRIVIDRAFT_192042 [Trichoderma virens Gv29-8]|uniref:Zn(2)-C6 fungal-type domain-containing protein n=1 Tax=Hypocrea virens (strain Gv29-8 / FGSC 10586) TaxID=413071 RepID=G9MVC8_HYPVG|nr:uncharacterized protein TRIVIDRAFT_192042 [Trichoderma virens Gv29-8]EHK21555.1 hypothetical protein TRIVIDRAFT_192042 [Trichoderma virens Gv29-8]
MTTTRSYRCAVACQACRQRKVRCSLAVTGKPCIGCTQDRAECIVVPKQRKKIKKSRQPVISHHDPGPMQDSYSIDHLPSDHVSNPVIEPSTFQNGPGEADPIRRQTYSILAGDSGEGEMRNGIDVGAPLLEKSQDIGITPICAADEGDIENEERRGFEIATAALGQSRRNGQVPFYSGGQTGPTYALDICSPEKSLPRHFLIPSHSCSTLSDADRSYLQAKGVLTLPSAKSCESLLRAYLHHVHPIMPVIEVDRILEYQHNGRLHEYNTLLLWSIFLAAVNFISPEVYEQEGYKSRKEMKATMYSRAKGMDKVVLIQSSLLMGFWISKHDEYLQPWYWTGTAINLCQMLGLHRNPDSSKPNCAVTDRQRCLWRRLWWTSFYRDRWLGMSFGRPLRINLIDCDMPMPTATDLLIDVVGLHEKTSHGFLPSDLSKLASYWVTLIELSKQLGAVIAMNYQSQRSKPTIQQFEHLESEILQCALPSQYESGLANPARFHLFHVHLHYQALLICLYRPYGSETPIDLDTAEQDDWQHRMCLKAGDAASKTNDIFHSLVEDGLLVFAGPMTPSLLVPAMQTHLLFYKSPDSLTKRLRLHKLEMCMLIMEELQKIYNVASIYRGIFFKAMQQICPSYRTGMSSSDQAIISVPTKLLGSVSAFANITEQETDSLGEFMGSLLDETSIFKFWETWNSM